ncbi:hypothetical protein DICSQDRAFT_135563 [Dichomitus squalens LYAD-421 SS1]|uniref:uncharacterized protein n=1 Tax=Dichomitus squalens (strain LYAD-421) TaxID=732165 RepID=UPI000441178A|nr:uncharacterized protein DICSQDRAFT_135563 [Dichomitus squalens LYAD-421 SS1]EJF62594.1 hypothetical protein DICSQDRAFT_135563 [Dichomitus squalens LYAD-421 SS1]
MRAATRPSKPRRESPTPPRRPILVGDCVNQNVIGSVQTPRGLAAAAMGSWVAINAS